MIPTAFKEFLYHFHVDRDYFECHEILEEYWKEETAQEKDSVWVGFILLAVANYHHRRSNLSGATRTLTKSMDILKKHETKVSNLGLDIKLLMDILSKHQEKLLLQLPYSSYDLPIVRSTDIDDILSKHYVGAENWGKSSDMNNDQLIHRHMLRDRTETIMARKRALEERTKDSE